MYHPPPLIHKGKNDTGIIENEAEQEEELNGQFKMCSIKMNRAMFPCLKGQLHL